jgi:nucleoside-diphosphate-sugar epimerase
MPKTILITGTDGFVGDCLRAHLEGEGHSVWGTCFFKPPRDNETRVDLRTGAGLDALPEADFDVVIHTAGIVDQNAPKKRVFAVNCGGTQNILKWAQAHHCQHFVQVSSSSVYGRRVMGERRRESTTPRIRGHLGIPYAMSKAKAERLVEQSGLPYTMLRLPGVIGNGDTCLTHVIAPRLLRGDFYFCGGPDRQYSTLYVKNFADIVSKVLNAGPLNDTYNCTDYQITWRALIQEYAAQLKVALPSKSKPLFSLLPRLADKDYALMLVFSRFGGHYPNDKLCQALAYEPQYPWQEGVKAAVEGWLATHPS